MSTRVYREVRMVDGVSIPRIPESFLNLVRNAMDIAQDCETYPLPDMTPDVCIINYYEQGGKLGMHQDRDETTESITRGIPVMSFSIGDDAKFIYGDQKRMDLASKIILKCNTPTRNPII